MINKFEYECDLCCGRYLVDAKSLMGIITLQGYLNLDLIIHANNPERMIQDIAEYGVCVVRKKCK